MAEQLTAERVRALLDEAGVYQAALTISDDPAVWTDIFTGVSGTSVRIDGPKEARRAAENVLFGMRFSVAPYPDHDLWSE